MTATAGRASAWDVRRDVPVKSPVPIASQSVRWLTVAIVAARLGLDARSIRRRIASGDIPATRSAPGGHYRVPSEWVDAHLERVRTIIRRKTPGGNR